MRLLIAEPEDFSPRAFALLNKHFTVRALELDRPGLLNAVRDAEILWVRLGHRVDREVMEHAPGLRAVATNTTGLNHIDMEEAARRGIAVVSLKGETEFLSSIRATAEHALGLLLALARCLPRAHAHVLSGGWDRNLFQGVELFGKTAGIVGYGRLGRIMARYLLAMDMRVLASDPHVLPENVAPGVTLTHLDNLLAQADAVSVHVNLTQDTRGFFGARAFAAMRKGALFINTGRGELVDEAALLSALESGHLGGAALDVLAGEDPAGMAGHPLVRYAREHKNLVLTPHIGGNTRESFEKTEVFLADRLIARFGPGKTGGEE
jgi:D-3-phosphoglycerate dehydrogenase